MAKKCEICGCQRKSMLEKHHIDYKNNVTVILCKSCHGLLHGFYENKKIDKVDWRRFRDSPEIQQIRNAKNCDDYQTSGIRWTENAIKSKLKSIAKKYLQEGGQSGQTSRN